MTDSQYYAGNIIPIIKIRKRKFAALIRVQDERMKERQREEFRYAKKTKGPFNN
jgi:hypothetical protein